LKTSLSEPKPWKRVLDIEVPSEDVEKAISERVSTYRKKMRLPGFRPGKAPTELIRSRYGEAIRAETIEDIVQESYEKACKEKGVAPVTGATVSSLKDEKGVSLTFTIETEVEPAIEVKGYEKLKIRPSPNKIKSADIDRVVEDLRMRNATFNDVDRAARKGDFVMFTYDKVTIDGSERTDISSPTYPVEVGTSSIKGFDKAVIGSCAGQTVEASISFPKDYPDNDIANKKGSFTLTIKKVQERVLPELTEEFLKKLGDFADENALRERIGKDLEQRESARAKAEASSKAVDTLIKNNPFEIPPSLVERYLDAVLEEMKQRAEHSGQQAPTREEVDQHYRESGIHTMKRHRILSYVATKENIRATPAEVDEQIATIAQQYGQPVDTLKEALRRNGTTLRIRDDIRERKTLDYLIGEYDPSAQAAEPAQPDETASAST
jgi:trigger factor